MGCNRPLDAYIGREEKVTFSFREAFRTPSGKTFPLKLPCGQCLGCRLERSRMWAVRCIHEASLYEVNCFITLTFSEDTVNKDGTLVKADFQKFMKRLRKRFPNRKIRFFHCGEYGEDNGRPHHHACLFNIDFEDKELWSTKNGVNIYTSPLLSELWPYGHHTIGDVTFDSAAYIARYVVKKFSTMEKEKLYSAMKEQSKDSDTYADGRVKEYITMSRRPGIGDDWINAYMSDVYPHDFVVVRGNKKCKPPRFYDDRLAFCNESVYNSLKKRREVIARDNPDNRPERLEAKERCLRETLKRKERSYETEGV